jgi:hypothetical protein
VSKSVARIHKKRIKVALARKLGVLMHHLLRSGQDYRPYPNGDGPEPSAEVEMIRTPVTA